MSTKRHKEPISGTAVKRCRKSITLELKLDVIRRIKAGERQSEVARSFNLSGSTVRTITKNTHKIKECGKVATPLSAVRLCHARAPIMIEMERLLTIWIEDNLQAAKSMSFQAIQDKARGLYQDLLLKLPHGTKAERFTASKGWFDRYRKRYKVLEITNTGEPAVLDKKALSDYKNELRFIISEGGYTPQQVFNVDETGLFWKRLPENTEISREEKSKPGFKISKDRLSILLGGNAAGDFKLKPLLVYHSENPRALKGYLKSKFPVIWKSNKKIWITMSIFQDWFTEYFCPAVENYCIEKNIPHKILLILDNSPAHASTLEDINTNVKVVFMPTFATTTLQPMVQGVIGSFKMCYVKTIFSQALNAIEEDDKITLKEFWKEYNIRNAIHNISSAWNEIPKNVMCKSWEKLWKSGVQNEPEEINSQYYLKSVVFLGKKIGLSEITENDIQDLIDLQTEELSNDDLMAIEQERAHEEDEDDAEVEKPKLFNIRGMAAAFKHLEYFLSYFKENDPDMERSSIVARMVNSDVNCYKLLWEERKKARAQLNWQLNSRNDNSPVVESLPEMLEVNPDIPNYVSSDDEDHSVNSNIPNCALSDDEHHYVNPNFPIIFRKVNW